MSGGINKWVKFRILLVFIGFLCAFAVLFAKAYNLQIIQHGSMLKIAESQRLKSIPLTPKRGFIYDKNGEMLAVSIEVDSVFANPREIDDPRHAASVLSDILGVQRSLIAKKLENKKLSFVWLKRKVSFNEMSKIKRVAIKGVETVKESKRYYPNFNLASHLLGFAGIDSKGLEGLELKYDYFIRGDQKYLLSEMDALGKTVSVRESSVKWSDGCDLYLTIDKNIQHITETELKKAVEGHDAKAGIVIVQEPKTGRILAMASYPDFNPNIFQKFTADSIRNRAIYDHFDPGSTFKPFIAAAAIEEKVVKPNDIFFCENGIYYVDSVGLRDAKKHGWLSLKNIIKYSSNIGAIKIADRLGKERLYNYLAKFGFGDRTNIDLSGESQGILRSYKKWTNVDFSTIAFGQGISTTALQLVNAFSVFANGGKLMKPYIVGKIVAKDQSIVREFAPEIVNTVISEETARTITKFLVSVVEEKGTGIKASIDNYTVAGKTGTAQKVDYELKTYSDEKWLSSFIGYAPVNNPIVTVGVFIDEPKEGKYGGDVAAPVFKNIVSQVLNLQGAVPIDVAGTENARPGSVTDNAVKVDFTGKKIKYVKAGGESIVMPDLAGMSIRQILDSFANIDLGIKIKGSGRVVEQHPQPGEIITKGREVFIRCATSF